MQASAGARPAKRECAASAAPASLMRVSTSSMADQPSASWATSRTSQSGALRAALVLRLSELPGILELPRRRAIVGFHDLRDEVAPDDVRIGEANRGDVGNAVKQPHRLFEAGGHSGRQIDL